MEKVKVVGVKKEKGFLYFVDKDGDVSRAVMARGKRDTGKRAEKIAKAGVTREQGYLYFVDKQGDISRSKMQHGKRSA